MAPTLDILLDSENRKGLNKKSPPAGADYNVVGDRVFTIEVKEAGANDVEVIFADDGCGMSPDVRRQAFDPFFTTRRHLGCTGLGLHIVYSVITDRLGGRLDLKSEPGRGTRVELRLPRMAPGGSDSVSSPYP